MYYIIINHTNQIIAADNSFLQAIHADTLENLNRQLVLETISLDTREENEILVTTSDNVLHFQSVSTTLSSILGDLTLVNVSNIEHKNIDVPPAISEEELALFDLTIPKTSTRTIDNIEVPEDVEISFDEASVPKVDLLEKTSTEVDSRSPIYIDIDKVSEEIGISKGDYNNFLSEYIDTAISLEPDLRSSNQNKQSSASHTLMQLADVLQLPVKLDTSDTETSTSIVEKFYDTLSKLTTKEALSKEALQKETVSKTTQASSTEHAASLLMDDLLFFDDLENQNTVQDRMTENTIDTTPIADISPEIDLLFDDPLPEQKKYDTEPIEEILNDKTINTQKSQVNKSFGTLNLDEVKPIPFEFNISDAANDLSLPVDLIEEFVKDFILQARTETKKMVESYKKGNLQGIQKIGHLLKGASSNLRIEPLSNSLYDIQFCENSNKLENLIYTYWGHFLAFEQQINDSK